MSFSLDTNSRSIWKHMLFHSLHKFRFQRNWSEGKISNRKIKMFCMNAAIKINSQIIISESKWTHHSSVCREFANGMCFFSHVNSNLQIIFEFQHKTQIQSVDVKQINISTNQRGKNSNSIDVDIYDLVNNMFYCD